MVRALGAFAEVALTTAFPENVRRVLCASSLIPLRKKDGGVRPIAVGDTHRRVVGKCLLRSEASPLCCQGRLLCDSHIGVHQGDACGPLGFALGLDTGLDQCEPRELAWESWYLDDGHIVGKVDQVLARLADLKKVLELHGLALNLAKCKLWGPGILSASQTEPQYPRCAQCQWSLSGDHTALRP